MKIYYFSGTGNSFYAAKQIASNFSATDIISISGLLNEKEITICNDKIIIVCPLYFYGIPQIVINFLEKLDCDNIKYFCVIFTAEYPNGIAIDMLKEICRRKDIKLNSSFYLKMPTNYLIKSKMLTSVEIKNILYKSEEKLARIINYIKSDKNIIEKDSIIYSFLINAKKQYRKWMDEIFPNFDSQFSCSENCNSCKLCEKHCPAGNITVSINPVWNKQCEACLKCINICPMQAILYDNKTSDKKRYFNPNIKISEFR